MELRLPNDLSEIAREIYLIRGQRVMLDSSLAGLYGVETKALNRAVRRNRRRFPEDFMFQLTGAEAQALRCQIGTSKRGRGGRRYLPHVFTEFGAVMLSSVLNSQTAIDAGVMISRAFVSLRRFVLENSDLAKKVDGLERRLVAQEGHVGALVEAMEGLMGPEKREPRRIGFLAEPPEEAPGGKAGRRSRKK